MGKIRLCLTRTLWPRVRVAPPHLQGVSPDPCGLAALVQRIT
jgi:hypothetical protein